MSIVEILLVVIAIAQVAWIVQLRHRVRLLEEQTASRPPDPQTLTVRDLQHLQNSLTELVSEIEQYSESQLRRMNLQSEALRTLCERMELKLKEAAVQPPMPVQMPVVQAMEKPSLSRLVPLTPRQSLSNHKDHDRIIELYKRGWEPEKIARELRLTRGEVQMIVNLS